MFRGLVACACWLACVTSPLLASPPIRRLVASAQDRRVDLVWPRASSTDEDRFFVYRSASLEGPFQRLNEKPHRIHVYSDFIGENGRTRFYRVTRLDENERESIPSEVVSATTRMLTEDELLSSVQQATLRYFWEFGHPVSGLAREGYLHPRSTVTTGGTGFGMMAIIVGVERGFVPRVEAAARLLKMVRFLSEVAPRYHGMWAHWLDGTTGETIPFAGARDNGGDLVESAFLIQGMLTVQQYFDRDDAVEVELRRRIARLWREMEWNWYLREPAGNTLYWHWSPDHVWAMNHPIRGFNECMIAYVLALASPTHPIPIECYERGWVHDASVYATGGEHYGIKQIVGPRLGGPLFFTHYSYLGLDPRRVSDRFGNYFELNRTLTQINRAHCVANPGGYEGYGPELWGLTSSQNPKGYRAHSPTNDDGTIAPTAALSAMPYTPEESLRVFRHLYVDLGPRIWGPFGFHDAFNLDQNWVSSSFLAIDQGPIVVMIENYRSQLLWRLFMANPEIIAAIEPLRGKRGQVRK